MAKQVMGISLGGPNADPPVLAEDGPVLLVRYRHGVVGESARIVHVVTPPGRPARMLVARCGAILIPGDLEAVALGAGMPCITCVLRCVADVTTLDIPPSSAPNGDSYQQWGWPVTLHRDQVSLPLEDAVSAWMIPAPLCAGVIPVLIHRRCAPPVLAHPYAPEHRIVLTGERYGLPLPWPEQARQVTGVLLLPPTRTPRGPIIWTTAPHPDSLRRCREIDLFTALRTADVDPSALA